MRDTRVKDTNRNVFLKIRILGNLTMRQAAIEAGVTPATWNHWEHGYNTPSTLNLHGIASRFGISAEEILASVRYLRGENE